MTDCPICEKPFQIHGIKPARDGYYYQICRHCSGGILMPRAKALKALARAYEKTYFDWKEANGLRKFVNKISLFTPYHKWINNQTGNNRGRLLDVGAGIPEFVITMKNWRWDPYALEISPEQVRLIKKYLGKNKVWQGDFERKVIKNNFFQVLTYWHMLEHLIKPASAIRKSSRILQKNGMIFAEFPNFDSLNLQIFGRNYCYFDLPGHLVYYNKKSLEMLFNNNGFKELRISYPLKLNGSFSLNLSNVVFKITGIRPLSTIVFYLFLPLSMLLSVLYSFTGQTDLMRISAKKN